MAFSADPPRRVPDSRVLPDENTFGPAEGTPPVPPDAAMPPAEVTPPPLPDAAPPAGEITPPSGTAATPSGFAGDAVRAQPQATAVAYDPRTGRYVGGDGRIYRQTNMTTSTGSATWTDLLPH